MFGGQVNPVISIIIENNNNKNNNNEQSLENICRAEQPQTCTIEDELNIDGGKHVLAMFLN